MAEVLFAEECLSKVGACVKISVERVDSVFIQRCINFRHRRFSATLLVDCAKFFAYVDVLVVL